MTSWFVDSSVLLTAFGEDHPARAECRRLLDEAVPPRHALHLSVEAVQEFLFHRMRRSTREAALARTDRIIRGSVLHPFDVDVLARSMELVSTTSVRGRDAVIAATALLAGFDTIVSLDADFDVVPGLSRISPETALG